MPKRKRKGRPSSSSASRPLDQNPNPKMNQEEDDDVQQIENPQIPIPILDSQDEIPKIAPEQEEEEDNKGESFDAQVEPEGLRNVTARRANNKRREKDTKQLSDLDKKDTISIEEEDEDLKGIQTPDVVVHVNDHSLDEIADPSVMKEQIPTATNDGIHGKAEDLEAESDHGEEDEEGMTMNASSPIQLPPVEEGVVFNCVFDNDVNNNNNNNSPTASNVSKQVPKRNTKTMKRKKSLNAKKKAALDKKLELARKKLEILQKNLQVIPFSPGKKLDFSKYEELFKRLGLWDFVHLEFDLDLRADLIALLVANYDPNSRSSDVNGCRIKVNRADLARALKLPGKKEKGVALDTTDLSSEALSGDAIPFIEEFVSSWILLHEDTWMLPKEVVAMTALIKSGQPHKVDWPSLIWFMVEKELKAAPEVGTLYYASHIQCLMKSQREDLFKEEDRQDDPMDEEEVGVDLTMGSTEDNQGEKIEKEQFELCPGQIKDENEQPQRKSDAMEYQDGPQESSGPAEWLMDDKSNMNDLSLRHCNFTDAQNHNIQGVMEEEAEDDDGCDPQSEEANGEGLVSTDFLQGIGATDVTYSQSFRFPGHSSGDIYHSGIDINLNTGETSMFPNSCKRENSHDRFVDDHIMSGHHKRMRNDGSSSEFSLVLEQINSLTEKARILYEEKSQASFNARMNERHFLELQQQNDALLNNLQTAQWESHQKDKEIYRLEHELHLMTSLLKGYKKAVKENRQAFSEYRERNPKYEEPLYKDVGPGGLVLSTIEIERQLRIVETFRAGWFEKLESCANDVSLMNQRLLGIEDNVKLLKEKYANPETEDNSINEV